MTVHILEGFYRIGDIKKDLILHVFLDYKIFITVAIISFGFGQNISCGEVIELYKDGNIEFCRLAKVDTISNQIFPKGTGVHFTPEGTLNWVFLPEDMEIQGLYCLGGGHSFMTGFYPNGRLKTVWLGKNEIIQGIPCSKFRFLSEIFYWYHGKGGSTRFHENGQLKQCELSKAYEIEGQYFRKGDLVKFDIFGKLLNH